MWNKETTFYRLLQKKWDKVKPKKKKPSSLYKGTQTSLCQIWPNFVKPSSKNNKLSVVKVTQGKKGVSIELTVRPGIDQKHFADLLHRALGETMKEDVANRLFSVFDKGMYYWAIY